jgi:hypothetical protein
MLQLRAKRTSRRDVRAYRHARETRRKNQRKWDKGIRGVNAAAARFRDMRRCQENHGPQRDIEVDITSTYADDGGDTDFHLAA